MVECGNCNQPVLGGTLVDVMKHVDGQDGDIPQKWCLDCIRRTRALGTTELGLDCWFSEYGAFA